MYASLLKTDIFHAIEKRLGRALIAQRMVSQYFSDGLGDYHWVDEVKELVATSHARAQINTWSIASGEDSDLEGQHGYTEITKDKATYGNLCGKFKFNPPEYASIHFGWFITVIVSLPVLRFLSLECSSVETFCSWVKEKSKRSDAARAENPPANTEAAVEEQPTPQPPPPPLVPQIGTSSRGSGLGEEQSVPKKVVPTTTASQVTDTGTTQAASQLAGEPAIHAKAAEDGEREAGAKLSAQMVPNTPEATDVGSGQSTSQQANEPAIHTKPADDEPGKAPAKPQARSPNPLNEGQRGLGDSRGSALAADNGENQGRVSPTTAQVATALQQTVPIGSGAAAGTRAALSSSDCADVEFKLLVIGKLLGYGQWLITNVFWR